MKNNHIIPTVFSHDKREFEKRFRKLIGVTKKIQIDFMDGKFVHGESIFLSDVPNLKRYKNEFEAHLMVKNPKEWIVPCKDKGFKRIIFHVEAVESKYELEEIVKECWEKRLEVYLAINPSTSLRNIYFVVKENKVNGILLLGVHPGKEGQKLSWKVPRRIRKIKRMNSKIIVQVDGGVNDKNVSRLACAGVNFVNSGSFVSGSDNPEGQINKLEKRFIEGLKKRNDKK